MGKAKNLVMTQIMKLGRRQKPDPMVWMFSSTDNRHYNYNSRYLFEYVKDNLKEVTPYFVINDPVLREKLSQKYGAQYFIETESKAGIRKVLGAGVWFTSAGLPLYGTNLRKGRLIVNLWHGVPLKKIALLDPNLKSASRIYFKKIFTENYSCILTSSSSLVPVMAKSFAVPENMIKVWGQPRNDRIFVEKDRNRILEGFFGKLPEYEKVILYAPTFRDNGRTRIFPFKDYDREALESFLERKKILICVRTHISERGSAAAYLSRRIVSLDNEKTEDVTGLLDIFDLLITDYSSIYIDYLLTGKPQMFLPYDKEDYLADRGMNFDYDEVTPGPKPESQKAFMDELEKLLKGQDAYAAGRDRCNDFFNEVKKPCCPGICEAVLKQIQEEKECQ